MNCIKNEIKNREKFDETVWEQMLQDMDKAIKSMNQVDTRIVTTNEQLINMFNILKDNILAMEKIVEGIDKHRNTVNEILE